MASDPSFPLKQPLKSWNDDKRMNSLFSPFRQKESNPVDYETKLKFWVDLIDSWCLENGRGTFTVKYLLTVFRRKNAFPACLQTVVEELTRSGDVMTKDRFLSLDATESWARWAVRSIVKTPAVWSFNKLKEALIEIDPGEIEYVSIKFLKAAGTDVVVKCEKEGRTMMDFDEFYRVANAYNEEQASLILRWLTNERKASTIVHSGKLLAKIGPGAISEAEIAVMKINDTLSRLNQAVEILEKEKNLAVEDAKCYLRKNMRQSAKNCLRRKNEIEKQITKKLSAIDNLDSLLCRIRDAKSDAEILDCYKLGISALKTTFSETGLDEDSVANTMSELEEINEIHEEIENALAQPIGTSGDHELEDELKSILAAAEKRDTSVPEVPDLPDVPSAELSPTKSPSFSHLSASTL
uniref:Charged multivesicular body protein 7 n=1 Tax=Lygus hesperus TaxID=30085 RepID=A0A0A9Y3W9_LYGHE